MDARSGQCTHPTSTDTPLLRALGARVVERPPPHGACLFYVYAKAMTMAIAFTRAIYPPCILHRLIKSSILVQGALRAGNVISLLCVNANANEEGSGALTVCDDEARSLLVSSAGDANARFRVHKSAGERGVRLFESVRFPECYLRISDGVADCRVRAHHLRWPSHQFHHHHSCHNHLSSRSDLRAISCVRVLSSLQGKRGVTSAQFVVHRRREWGNCVELESCECRRLFVGVAATGLVRPAVYTRDLNVRLYVQLVTRVLLTLSLSARLLKRLYKRFYSTYHGVSFRSSRQHATSDEPRARRDCDDASVRAAANADTGSNTRRTGGATDSWRVPEADDTCY